MRKLFLSILAAGVLAPSLAMAGTTTYLFQYFSTGNPPLTGAAIGSNAASLFGTQQFYVELAAKVSKGTKTCPDLSATGTSTFTSSVVGVLKKVVSSPGDEIAALGSITTPGVGAAGPISGTAFFASQSSSPGLTNGDILNTSNTPSSALLCGGKAGSSGPIGTCGNGFNCVPGILTAKASADPNLLTDCSNTKNAGQTLTTTGGITTENINSFVYPYAGSLCNTPGETWADCCHDKTLVLLSETANVNNPSSATNNGPSTIGLVVEQGAGGYTQSYTQ